MADDTLTPTHGAIGFTSVDACGNKIFVVVRKKRTLNPVTDKSGLIPPCIGYAGNGPCKEE